MPRMTAAQIKGLPIDKRVSIIERTATAKALINEEKQSLEDVFAAHIERYGLPEPVRQFRFDDTPVDWRWDFGWPQYKLLVEINGGIYQDPPTKCDCMPDVQWYEQGHASFDGTPLPTQQSSGAFPHAGCEG